MRGLLCITIALAAGALAVPDASDARCKSLDSSCEDFFLAAQCGTTKQCISRWERLELPVVNEDTKLCTTCKTMVKEARDTLLSNETQYELRQVLEGSCDVLIPIRGFDDFCKELMDTFQDELNDVLVSRMDPAQVCAVAGLCYKSPKSDIVERASALTLFRKEQKKPCETCKKTINTLSEFTSLFSKSDLSHAFRMACEKQGFPQAKCHQFSQTYVHKFLQQLQLVPAEKTCKFFGQCGGSPRPIAIGVQDNLECEFCEAMIHKVVVQFNNTSAKTEVKTTLTNICKHTGAYAKECQERIDNDFDKAYDEVLGYLNPEKVCGAIGLCNKDQVMTLPMAKMTPARPAQVAAPALSVACPVCRTVAIAIESALESNVSETQLINVLHSACQILPIKKDVCLDFVEKNLPQLIQMFKDKYSADYICSQELKLCAPSTNSMQSVMPPNAVSCNACRTVASLAERAVTSNVTQKAALNLLSAACNILPINKEVCLDFVEHNLPPLFEMFSDRYTPDYICGTKLQYCDIAPEVAPKAPTGEVCETCENIAAYLVAGVNNNRTEKNIKAILEKTCELIPMDVASCQQFIDQHTDALYSLLRQDITVDSICKSILLCASKTVQQMPTDNCETCDLFATFLISELKDDKTEKAIVSALSKVCSVLPVDSVTCRNSIDTYGQLIVDMIQNNVSPDEICKAIGLCGSYKVQEQVPKSDNCAICGLIANFVLEEIKDDKTDAAILSGLERVCSVLPVDAVTCKNTVDVYGSQILKLIQSNATPDQICKAIGLCAVAKAKKVQVQMPKDSCALCGLIAGFLVNELKDNKTDQAIVTALEKVCSVVPVDATTCKLTIDVYGSEIIELIQKNATPQEICSAIKLCAAAKVKEEMPADNCALCGVLANFLVNELKDNETDQAIIAALGKVCSAIPDSIVDGPTCQSIVNVYGQLLIQLIQNNATPDQICATIGLCVAPQVQQMPKDECVLCGMFAEFMATELEDKKTEAAIVSALGKVCKRLPVDAVSCQNTINVYGNLIINMIQNNVSPTDICKTIGLCGAKLLEVKPQSGTCTLCTMVTDYLVDKLASNSTDAAILDALDKVCKVLPVDSQNCQNIINTYGGIIIHMIQSNVASKLICSSIGLCDVPIQPPKADDCELCSMVTGYVVELLKDNKTESAIIFALEKVCSELPVDAAECQNTVEVYGAMIIKLIQQNATPDVICQTIGLCTVKKPMKKIADEGCTLCKTLAIYLTSELQDNKNEQAIEAALEKVCTLVPSQAAKCKQLVDQYTDEIIKLIIQDATPDEICAAIGVCTPQQVKPKSDENCETCKIVVETAINYVKDQKNEDFILTQLEKLCSVVPVDTVQCKNYVDVYADQIFKYITQGLTADQICAEVGICQAKIRDSA